MLKNILCLFKTPTQQTRYNKQKQNTTQHNACVSISLYRDAYVDGVLPFTLCRSVLVHLIESTL